MKRQTHETIYAQQNQTLIKLFNDAPSLDKILCIPLDYAKLTNMALFCNGSGKVIKKPLHGKTS